MKRILVTGAVGQIGSELVTALRKVYGGSNVVATGRQTKPSREMLESGPFKFVDCTDIKSVGGVVEQYKIDTIYHLASMLSARAEKKPLQSWHINMDGLLNVLEVARKYQCAVFTPSSIGAFGPSTPLDNTPQDTIQRPNKVYGISKITGELWCDYYYQRYKVNTRGVRYPGIISNVTRPKPGSGTTDYAVDIFYEAIKNKNEKYTCYLKEGTYLDMMYMPDCIKAAIDLMEADPAKLKHRNAFNVTAMSFEPEQLAAEIRKHIPVTMDYEIDPVRQAIAESWPNRMDDSVAREEWGWQPEWDLARMTKNMIEKVSQKLGING